MSKKEQVYYFIDRRDGTPFYDVVTYQTKPVKDIPISPSRGWIKDPEACTKQNVTICWHELQFECEALFPANMLVGVIKAEDLGKHIFTTP